MPNGTLYGARTQALLEEQKKRAMGPEAERRLKEAQREAQEAVYSAGAAQRQTFLREAQKRGMGVGGAARLGAARVGTQIAEAAGKAGRAARMGEEERQRAILGQMIGQQAEIEKLGMAGEELGFRKRMGEEELELAKQQFAESKNQFAKGFALEKGKFDENVRQFDAQLDAAEREAEAGRIHERDITNLRATYDQQLTRLKGDLDRMTQLRDQAFKSTEYALNREQEVKLQQMINDTKVKVAQIENRGGSIFGKILGGIGKIALGAATGGTGTLASLGGKIGGALTATPTVAGAATGATGAAREAGMAAATGTRTGR
jgi:hypothetical protein